MRSTGMKSLKYELALTTDAKHRKAMEIRVKWGYLHAPVVRK
jgi:hypothetical protein